MHMLTAKDETTIAGIIEKTINHAFAAHPRLDRMEDLLGLIEKWQGRTEKRLGRMEKRHGRIQRDINYLVEAIDGVELRQREYGYTLKDHELRLRCLEKPA